MLRYSAENHFPMVHSYSALDFAWQQETPSAAKVIVPDVTLVELSEGRIMLAFGGDTMMGRRFSKPAEGDPALIREEYRAAGIYEPEDGTVDVNTNGRKLRVNVEPTVEFKALGIGQEVILNEAFNVVEMRSYDPDGEVVTIKEVISEDRLIILGREGLLNTFITSLGLPPADLIYNYPAVLLGLVQYMLPFAVLLIAPAVTAISEDFELASEGLGANWIQTFRHVVIPMARPGLIGSSVVVFTLTLTDFAMPEILGGGTTDFIANSIYDGFFQISNPGLGAALAMILVTLGSAFVTVIFAMAGTGTLGSSGRVK